MELGSVWINEIIVHGAMKAHLIDNTDYSLSAEKPWCNYHTHRIQFEDGGWCWFRRGDDEEPTFEGHGVSVEIVNGRLIVKAREASRQFPDGDINPLEH
jgi:hypothetical protein